MDRELPLRAVAARVIQAVEQGESLNQCLPAEAHTLDPDLRPQLQALCYGTCRWFHRLDGELTGRLRKPLRRQDRIVHHLMLVALFQLRFSENPSYAVLNETVEACKALGKTPLAGLVNGVLRAAEREGAPDPTSDEARYSHPNWMIEKLRHNWPEHWQGILDANNAQAPMTLRVNRMHGSRDEYLARLQEAGIPGRATRFASQGIQLDKPVPVDLLPGFADGHVSVQDEAAQLCTRWLRPEPGQHILDACAAPGGKTCAILESIDNQGTVVAIDESADRLPRIQENLDRLQLSARLIEADAADIDQWWDGQPFDAILLDVPCSATGVIRRHPDIKLLRRETDITPLATIQMGLLSGLWQTLRPGGRLVYATCSVFPQENSRIIRRFLGQQADARLLDETVTWGMDTGHGRQLLPDPESHDGFFYACLVKGGPEESQ
ncbi:16S rRNA (cytosine(967)-C(5))-methyltransferase RsmB [Marinobacter zhanjiangensis]|uniref:16S rRNA (cytosine(967)-C(5))-methyltransferase n=1 Tax=Marinobacter zhanjiangensis TaxID=578215 RepID=A0ABQ3AQM9_9GAMM|nr:16S rRNA (cytosine(967)-C(5))-methyltransferase RsmB [Marinobacter zhanjiangensis]GGY60987.1 ribosomal RNA small subunit methyltransferase B [Marinobacter zhanjiangensis]